MTQKEIDTLFNITILIHESKWFGERNNPKDRDQVQQWVAERLANTLEIYTIPCGMSWGVKVDKDLYDEYWKENSNLEEI